LPVCHASNLTPLIGRCEGFLEVQAQEHLGPACECRIPLP
jgi:hypothetical protein